MSFLYHSMCIHKFHHYIPRTSKFVPKTKKWCRVFMSRHAINDPWPSIYWKCSDSTLQFHLKDINWPNLSYGKEEKNSTLRTKLLWINYSLHIEFASLFPLSLNTLFSPQDLPYMIENMIVSII
jgi:hypothetical protein